MGPTPDAKNMAMLAHLLGVLTGFVGPLIIWLVKKDDHPFIDDQGKEALNFQITMAICMIIASLALCVFFVGLVLVPAVGIVDLVFGIIAAIKAKDGINYRYPLAIRFIK